MPSCPTKTAGGTFAAGDAVKQDADDGKYTVVAADATLMSGWAKSAAADTEEFILVPAAKDVWVKMLIRTATDVDSASKRLIATGKNFALYGGTGAQKVDIGDTTHDLLTVREIVYDTGVGAYVAWVEAAYAATTEFVEPA